MSAPLTSGTVARSAVTFGAFWSCCAVDTDAIIYAGAFDREDGTVAWHGLCSACAHSYRRTVRGAELRAIVSDASELLTSVWRAVANGTDATIGEESLTGRFIVGGIVAGIVIEESEVSTSHRAKRSAALTALDDWLQSVPVRAALSEENRAVGVWSDSDGLIYVDVVDSVGALEPRGLMTLESERRHALTIADLRGELAIWDRIAQETSYVA